MLDGSTHELDAALLMMMRQPQDLSTPAGPRWLQEAARDITSLGGTTRSSRCHLRGSAICS